MFLEVKSVLRLDLWGMLAMLAKDPDLVLLLRSDAMEVFFSLLAFLSADLSKVSLAPRPSASDLGGRASLPLLGTHMGCSLATICNYLQIYL